MNKADFVLKKKKLNQVYHEHPQELEKLCKEYSVLLSSYSDIKYRKDSNSALEEDCKSGQVE
ncbi:hypothetical protein ABH14_23645 [Brevibacillus brevis]|nr:hypothetical protein [Brevibacillus brevis]